MSDSVLNLTNKQTIYSFDEIQTLCSAYNTRVQYLQDSDNNTDNKNYRNYLYRGPRTYTKWEDDSEEQPSIESRPLFKCAHNLNCKIS